MLEQPLARVPAQAAAAPAILVTLCFVRGGRLRLCKAHIFMFEVIQPAMARRVSTVVLRPGGLWLVRRIRTCAFFFSALESKQRLVQVGHMAGAVLRSSERPPTSGTTPPSTRGNTPQSDGPHGSSAVARLAGRASRSEGAMIRRAISAHPPGLYPCGSAASVARGMCSDKGIRRELAVGDSFNLVRTFTAEDVAAFSAVSLDQNPLHSDAAAARTAAFEAPVVHGMLVASMFSAIIGNTFPGSVYLSQTLKFVAPVAVGATVTAQVEVLKLKRLGGNVVASWKTTCTAAPRGGEPPRALIEGQALCRLPAATVP